MQGFCEWRLCMKHWFSYEGNPARPYKTSLHRSQTSVYDTSHHRITGKLLCFA